MSEAATIQELQERPATAQELAVLKQLAKKNLFFFAKFVLGYDWLDAKIHLPLCQILQDWKVNRRVRVLLPRSWLKSTVCSIAYPIWRAINDPDIRILLVQNSAANAKAKLRSIRGQWQKNTLLRALFPELLPRKDSQWTTEALCLNRSRENNEATFEAAGRATKLIGRHYNVIIEDDTVAPDQDEWTENNVLPVKDDIVQAIGFHRSCMPMLVDAMNDQIIVVGTRWFQLDLLSWICDKEKNYVSYERAVRETDGKPDPKGELTWPARFNDRVLSELEDALGPYLFSCLYLNNPLRDEDMIFQPQWFQYYYEPAKDIDVYITIDPAGNPKNSVAKGKRKNDYNVIMVAGRSRSKGTVDILDYVAFKGGPGELLDYLWDFVKSYKKWLVKVGVEGIAYQESLEWMITQRMQQTKLFFDVVLLKHSGAAGSSKKEWRIRALQPLVKTGTMRFKPWMQTLISQLRVFPLGVNDDLADACSMFLQLMEVTIIEPEVAKVERDNGFGLEEAVKNLAEPHRPPRGSVLDVFYTPVDGQRTHDPYAHLFSEESSLQPSTN